MVRYNGYGSFCLMLHENLQWFSFIVSGPVMITELQHKARNILGHVRNVEDQCALFSHVICVSIRRIAVNTRVCLQDMFSDLYSESEID